jgi:alanine-synthesizing transaminase
LVQAMAAGPLSPYQPTPFGLPAARAAVVADFARRQARIAPDAVALTASSSESYGLLFKLLADPGDVVLVPQPSYPLFDYLARLEGLEPRPYSLVYDGRWRIDFDTLDFTGARALCLVNPNNPTGSFVVRSDLERLSVLAAERNVALIVDEVFSDYPLAAVTRADAVTTVAALASPALTFSLGGLSKGSGLPQMKLGWIAAHGPDALVRDALRRLDLICDTYLSVGTAVQQALPRLLSIGAGIRSRITDRVRTNRALLASAPALNDRSPCSLLPTEAGWSIILRLPAVMSDEDWALRFLRQAGVLVQPGYFFDLPIPAAVVLSLLPSPAVFKDGLTRLLAEVPG